MNACTNHAICILFTFICRDLPPHDIWLATDESVVQAERTVAQDLRQGFNATVFMTIGNHENSIPNYFPPTTGIEAASNVTWLYREVDFASVKLMRLSFVIAKLSRSMYFGNIAILSQQ